MSKKNLLGKKFRSLRLARGLTGVELAKRMGVSQQTISLLELGKLKPTLKHANALAGALNLKGKELQDLKDVVSAYLAEFDKWQAENRGIAKFYDWGQEFGDNRNYTSVALLREADAQLVEDYHSSTIVGLLQAEEYARQLIQLVEQKSGDCLKKSVDLKLERQRTLLDSSKQFRFLVSEAALLNGAIPIEVMEAQIRHLGKIAQLPNVSLKFIPLKTPLGSHSYVSFSMYDRKLTVIEGLAQELTIWTEEENKMYAELFDRLSLDAVPLEALEFVRGADKEEDPQCEGRVYH